MNTIYNKHINNIDSMIEFLKKYKNCLENDNINVNSDSKVCAMFLLNNKFDELKDDALFILNGSDIDEPEISKEIKEYNETMDNIKSIMPFVTYLMLTKSSISFQQDL